MMLFCRHPVSRRAGRGRRSFHFFCFLIVKFCGDFSLNRYTDERYHYDSRRLMLKILLLRTRAEYVPVVVVVVVVLIIILSCAMMIVATSTVVTVFRVPA